MRRLAKVKFEGRKKLDYRVDEAYKSLRTNVQFSGSGVQVIDFTSCTPNEGKSSVAFNLAVSFAESGKRVIMIDADMRKSVLAGRYKVGSVDAGLAHYLSGQKTLDEVCLNTDIDGMDIIFSERIMILCFSIRRLLGLSLTVRLLPRSVTEQSS